MKVARVAVLAVALGAGVVAWTMSRSLVADEGDGQPVVQQALETENVLVAARDIQPGHMISSADITWEAWPRDSVNAAFVSQSSSPDGVDSVAGAVTRTSFVRGEPIRSSKIVRTGQGGYLSAVLPSGMRAVSTRTSPQTGAGGFILPNDRVDVILTRTSESSGGQGFVSARVLENVRVLAIDQTVEEQNGKMVVVGNVATLELKPEQTEILALAEQLGDISLALRSIMDGTSDIRANGPVSAGNLLGGGHAGTVGMVKFGVPSRVTVN